MGTTPESGSRGVYSSLTASDVAGGCRSGTFFGELTVLPGRVLRAIDLTATHTLIIVALFWFTSSEQNVPSLPSSSEQGVPSLHSKGGNSMKGGNSLFTLGPIWSRS